MQQNLEEEWKFFRQTRIRVPMRSSVCEDSAGQNSIDGSRNHRPDSVAQGMFPRAGHVHLK